MLRVACYVLRVTCYTSAITRHHLALVILRAKILERVRTPRGDAVVSAAKHKAISVTHRGGGRPYDDDNMVTRVLSASACSSVKSTAVCHVT